MHIWIIDDRYRVGDLISRRGAVALYEGRDTETGEPVLIKRFDPELGQNMSFVEGWRGQLLSVQALEAPGVQRIHSFGRTPEGALYQVEGVPAGVELDRWSHQAGSRTSVKALVLLLADIAEVLGAVHRDGVSHGGLHPRAIYLRGEPFDNDGAADPLFIDWELGELFAVGAGPRRMARYQPPERYEVPEALQTPSTDTYALGYILYELLTQEVPSPGGDTPAEGADSQTPVPPSRYNPDVSPALERILLRALDPDPAMRPPHAGAFSRSLRQAVERPATDEAASDAPRRAESRRPTAETPSPIPRAFWLGLTAIVVLLVVAAVTFAWQLLSAPEQEVAPVGATPNLIGLPVETADQLARSSGLTLEISGTVPAVDTPPDTVLEQSPQAGRLIPESRVVRVAVAGEPPTPAAVTRVPNLFGLSVQVADRLLRENGLTLGQQREAHDEAVPRGLIVEHNPRAGIQVATGTAVDVIVSLGPPPTQPPNETR